MIEKHVTPGYYWVTWKGEDAVFVVRLLPAGLVLIPGDGESAGVWEFDWIAGPIQAPERR